MPTQINFPGPGYPGYESGITCQIYSHGFTSSCLDEEGVTREVTQEWYFDGSLGVWMSLSAEHQIPVGDTGDFYVYGGNSGISLTTAIELDGNNLKFNKNLKYKVTSSNESLGSNIIKNISFDTPVHYINFFTDGNGGVTLDFQVNSDLATNEYQEIKLILKNPSYPDFLVMTGKDYDGNPASVYMDSPGTPTLSTGTYMWTVWTIDRGVTYRVYRTNGADRYWSD
jgi:hypothetical protein